MSLSDDQLTEIVRETVGHYDRNALSFWEGTKDHDVSQNTQTLLSNIRGEAPYRILDVGCGPGRDLAFFKSRGHIPIGVEGSAQLSALARKNAGCTVWEQNFLALDLPLSFFDGVFANATLFHVPKQELPRVLRELWSCLKKDGVFFSSNPRGLDIEGWNGDRYGSYHSIGQWRTFMQNAGFSEITHYYRPPGRPREEQPWLAMAWRK
ncbi:MAG: class I SAM-dependent methyltransferase [Myxococcota bacterium]|nr:class I SAM-dependent methyltransferase [Myxococcota bacterium]